VKDYAAFAAATGREVEKPSFAQTGDHPVVNVSWEDAKAFCEWLGKKEGREYRLPSDEDWSVAVRLPKESGATPSEKSGQAKVYPWGVAWPPPKGAGNYGSSLSVDEYERTSPVGSFAANGLGIYDLGGNVFEWCEDWYDSKKEFRVLRGASWGDDDSFDLRSSYRGGGHPGYRNVSYGFRVVMVDAVRGRYAKGINQAIGSRWTYYVHDAKNGSTIAPGSVTLRFTLNAKGKVLKVQLLDNSSNAAHAALCERSFYDAQPDIEPPPPELLKNGLFEDTFTFTLY
jgi:hypothetical protein